jgi:hypothetical protein
MIGRCHRIFRGIFEENCRSYCDLGRWSFLASYILLCLIVSEISRWEVTEKIHGANFCFIVDAKGIQCGKRREILGKRDSFYGYQRVLSREREKLSRIWHMVSAEHGSSPSRNS